MNFNRLGLKKLISTHYNMDGSPSYKMEYASKDPKDDVVLAKGIKKLLKGNGDFRSDDCIKLLKQSDLVVTNPPFSLAREYVAELEKYNKHFIIIGDLNWITYKEIFPLIKENKLWFGYTKVKEFKQPDGTYKKFGNKLWFTNLDYKQRHEDLILYKHYLPNEYPKYDNYDGINVDKTADIPMDFNGAMGVPITFLDKYSPEQFKLIKFRKGNDNKDLRYTIDGETKQPYFRIIIKNKKLQKIEG